MAVTLSVGCRNLHLPLLFSISLPISLRRVEGWVELGTVVKVCSPRQRLYIAAVNPLSPNRQHLSYDVCLAVRGEIIRNVLCCIVY